MCSLLLCQHHPSCDDYFAQRKPRSFSHLVRNRSFVVPILFGEHRSGVDRRRLRWQSELANAGGNVAGNVRYLPLLPSLLRDGGDQRSGVFDCSRLESEIGECKQLSSCQAKAHRSQLSETNPKRLHPSTEKTMAGPGGRLSRFIFSASPTLDAKNMRSAR